MTAVGTPRLPDRKPGGSADSNRTTGTDFEIMRYLYQS
ncbi:hypothetical protein Hsw_3735 [Hymenobacter swuensis DY53]|uniref:Uncharacterized protein n=1 Tax=Hymenobacter swuensis DY53 TaxID=1227739 RepID=W8FCB0_9BACT|nr:hypothetical protein Hsw_3735 [Hymenobacter swuensis DY53]